MQQKGEYIYEFANYNGIDKIKISVIDNSESYARAKAIAAIAYLPSKNGSGWNNNNVTLIEMKLDNISYTTTQGPDWYNIQNRLGSIEQNIRELNERGKKARL